MNPDLDCSLLRERAYQCRVLAGGMRDLTIRERLLELAIDYDALALQTDRKLIGQRSSPKKMLSPKIRIYPKRARLG